MWHLSCGIRIRLNKRDSDKMHAQTVGWCLSRSRTTHHTTVTIAVSDSRRLLKSCTCPHHAHQRYADTVQLHFLACPTARLRADASDAYVWSQQAAPPCIASFNRPLSFSTRRSLGKALLVLSRRFVIRSAYSSPFSASIILAFCSSAYDYSPRGRANIDTVSASAFSKSCSV